jgi:hypothetical protein
MSKVDDHGLYDARVAILRSSLYPLRVNRVREADISRWIAACEKAGLIALYEHDGKPYLQMLDTRWSTRSAPKFPLPPTDCNPEQPLSAESSCKQLKTTVCLDGDGVVVEDDIPTPLPSARAGENSAFRMFVDWKPSPHLSTLAHQSGLPMPDSNAFNAAIGEFIAYWLTQTKARTQHEWDHALVKALQGNRLRGSSQKTTSGRQLPKSENFAAIDYGEGGRL